MKDKLCLLFLVVGLHAGVNPVLAQVTLGIMPTNKQALLYWPATATNYVLQSNTSLSSTNWTNVPLVVQATNGSQTVVTVTNTFQLPTSRGRLRERFLNFSMYKVKHLWCNTGDADHK